MAHLSTARSIFQDTAFGRLMHACSGGRAFAWKEFGDEDLVDSYLRSSDNRCAGSPDDEIAETGRDYLLITFVKDDPQNPRNWSSGKKAFVTSQICLLTTTVYMGSAIFISGLEDVMADFNISSVTGLLGLTLFVLGYSLGPMLWSPLSEAPFIGRGLVYIGTYTVFVGLQPAIIFAKNFGTVLAFRFLTGFIGSPCLATGGASIADMYTPEKIAYALSLWQVAAMLGLVMAPLLGNFAAENKGWMWSIWELTWLSGFCLMLLFFFLPETSSSNILFRRTQRLRKIMAKRETTEATASGKQDNVHRLTSHNEQSAQAAIVEKETSGIKSQGEIDAEGFTTQKALQMLLVRPFTLMLFEPIVFFINIYIAVIYAILYLWFESFPIVFGEIYGFNPGSQGLCFLGILVGSLITLPCWWVYLYLVFEPAVRRMGGKIKPEMRLPPACVGCFCIPLCLFIFGWASRRTVHWVVPIIGTAFFSPGIFLIFQTALIYLGDAYPRYVASVYAGNDFVRSSFGAACPLFANAMFHNLGVPWGNTLLALLSVLFIPIPFILVRFGKEIRMRSKNATHD